MTVDNQTQIISEFQLFDDWIEKYEYIIDLGKRLESYPEVKRKDKYLIKGCQSKVWLYSEYKEGIMHYFADSNTDITKGLIAILIRVFNNKSPQEVIDTDISFIDKIELKQHLSPTRAKGLISMLDRIKADAILNL
jgi:cysteine desulfuration protein SufE